MGINLELLPLLKVVPDWLSAIQKEARNDKNIQRLKQLLEQQKLFPDWSSKDDFLFFKGQIYLVATSFLIRVIVETVHFASHEREEKIV